MQKDRDFDIVVYGATGFTGRLITEYLAAAAGDISWAIAGRNEAKLAKLREETGAPADLPLLTADAGDADALAAIAKRSGVILSAAGPYQLYGSKVVEACVGAGTDYVDLCGEPLWMREMILAHEEQAKMSGARIVFSCGFDSVPFDLGVWMLQREAVKETGDPLEQVKGRIRGLNGTFSGGTAASARATMAAAAKDPSLMADLINPFSLVPEFNGPPQPPLNEVIYDEDLKSWAAPFVMAVINTKNIHRSNYLMDQAYGVNFKYDEMVMTGDGEAGEQAARALAKMPPVGADKDGPKPGEGPDKDARENGSFDYMAAGDTGDGLIVVGVKGNRDPGYGATSRMISQCALCLSQDVPGLEGGIYTPAPAFGQKIIDRLNAHAGVTFTREK